MHLCLPPPSPVDGRGGCPPRGCLVPTRHHLCQRAGHNSPGALLAAVVLLSCVRLFVAPRTALLPPLDPEGWGRLEPQVHGSAEPQQGTPDGEGSGRAGLLRGGELLWPSCGAGPVQSLEDRPGPQGSPWSPDFLDSLGPHHPPFLFRLVEGHGPSCSPHAVACQGRAACLAAGVHSWTDAASGQATPRAPVDLISPGSPARPPRPQAGWGPHSGRPASHSQHWHPQSPAMPV